MLIPLYLLGQPAGGQGDLGGRLSVMRHQFNIAESDLGEISPASETMKLASLGLRGVAECALGEVMVAVRELFGHLGNSGPFRGDRIRV